MSHGNPRLKTWDLIEDAVFRSAMRLEIHFYCKARRTEDSVRQTLPFGGL